MPQEEPDMSSESSTSIAMPPPADAHVRISDFDSKAENDPQQLQPNADSTDCKEGKVLDELSAEELKELTSSSIDCAVEAVRYSRSNSMAKRHSSVKEENGLAKGIVLNASLFIHPQKTRWVPDHEVNDKSKDQELVQKYPPPCADEKKPEPIVEEEVTKMSFWRKIIFGFSFLPSILFVLCFAVILPCQEPHPPDTCVKETWSLSLNNTVLTSGITVSGGLLAGLSSDENGRIVNFDLETGATLWSWDLGAIPLSIDCKDFDVNGDDVSDCLLTDNSGSLYAFNTSDGYIFWNVTSLWDVSTTKEPLALPVTLPDCDGDGIREVAFAAGHNIYIISGGAITKTLLLGNCEKLMSLIGWSVDTQTDLVLSCQTKDEKFSVRLLNQSVWCAKDRIPSEQAERVVKIRELFNRGKVKLNKALFLPIPDGLAIWLQDEVIFLGNDAAEIWKTQSLNHTERRFLVYGNFSLGEHVALISSDTTHGVRVSLLSTVDGNETLTWVSPTAEVKKATAVSGNSQDYLLLLLEMLRDSEMQADLSVTNDTYVDVEYRITLKKVQKVEQKIILLESENKDSASFATKELYSDNYDVLTKNSKSATELSATVEGEDDLKSLTMFLGRTVAEELSDVYTLKFYTHLKKLIAENWDKHSPQCV